MRKREKDIFVLGLDFGTAYTKCVLRNLSDEQECWPIEFASNGSKTYFIESLLHIRNGKRLSPLQSSMEKDDAIIRFLKMRLLSKLVKSASIWEDNDPLELCMVDAAFFLSHIIAKCRDHIENKFYYEVTDSDRQNKYDLYINMCLPVAAQNDQAKEIFLKVLLAAYSATQLRSTDAVLPKYEEIENIMKDVSKLDINKNFCTCYPETSANLISFLRSPARQNGYYALVDVGGGTVDVTLLEYNSNNKEKPLWYYHSEVIYEGSSQIEIRVKKRLPQKTVREIRRYKEDYVDSDNPGSADAELGEIYKGVILEIHNRVGKAMGDCISNSFKKFGASSIEMCKGRIRGMKFFFCGNGMSKNPYELGTRFFHSDRGWRWRPEPDSVPFQPPKDLNNKYSNLFIDNRIFKRLSVAYGMSFMSENLTNCMFPSDIPISAVKIEPQRGHNPAADYEET